LQGCPCCLRADTVQPTEIKLLLDPFIDPWPIYGGARGPGFGEQIAVVEVRDCEAMGNPMPVGMRNIPPFPIGLVSNLDEKSLYNRL
jgi:hypothetical protein